MDTATAQKILRNYGMPITPQNMNAVMSEASNESALLGRSMGLQGGAGEDGYDDSLVKSRLSKLAGDPVVPTNNTSDSPAENPSKNKPAAIENVSKTYPDRANVSSTSASAATPNPSARGTSVGKGDVASAGAGTNASNDLNTLLSGAVPNTATYGVAPHTSSQEPSTTVPDWLTALLGLSATGAAASRGIPATPSPQITGPDTSVPKLGYQPKLANPGDIPTMPSGAPDTAANMPQPQSQLTAPEGSFTVPQRSKSVPVRPTFTPQEELMDALIQFRKMFRK